MGYRQRPEFDRPDAETVARTRQMLPWLIPLVTLQQGSVIFGNAADRFSHVLGTLAWTCVSLSMLWIFLGLPIGWLSERDQAIVNDERSRAVRGDAACWAIAALIVIGSGMMIARLWLPMNSGIAIYGLVNGALIVAVTRYAWLNRAERYEDE